MSTEAVVILCGVVGFSIGYADGIIPGEPVGIAWAAIELGLLIIVAFSGSINFPILIILLAYVLAKLGGQLLSQPTFISWLKRKKGLLSKLLEDGQ